MSAREFFNNNPAVVSGAAVLVLVLCLGAISCSLFGWGGAGGGSKNVQLVYYDLSNDSLKLVRAQDRLGSPLVGTETYLGYVMSCGECGEINEGMTRAELEAGGMYIAYLQTLPESDGMSRELMLEGQVEIYDFASEGWYMMNSEQGMLIAQDSRMCEDGSMAESCQP